MCTNGSPRVPRSRPSLALARRRSLEASLAEVQAFIESENKRLERDPLRCFDREEIRVRIEYRFCPNMIVIDTPGLIQAPFAAGEGGRASMRGLSPQQRALAQAAREVQELVLEKMRRPEYVILCVEDSADWKHGATREIVARADPELARTVLVNTKFDTKLMQFSQPDDVASFVGAPLLKRLHPRLRRLRTQRYRQTNSKHVGLHSFPESSHGLLGDLKTSPYRCSP